MFKFCMRNFRKKLALADVFRKYADTQIDLFDTKTAGAWNVWKKSQLSAKNVSFFRKKK